MNEGLVLGLSKGCGEGGILEIQHGHENSGNNPFSFDKDQAYLINTYSLFCNN